MNMGAQNQQKIIQNLNSNNQPVNIVNKFQNCIRTTNYQQQRQGCNLNATASNQYQFTSICAYCGQRWPTVTVKLAQQKKRNLTTVKS